MKSLVTRAIAAEVGATVDDASQPLRRVALPLFGDPRLPKVRLGDEDIARALAESEAEALRSTQSDEE